MPDRPARRPPTFAQYVPQVAAAVPAGSRRAYGSYWKRVVAERGDRNLDDILPSQIEQLRNTVQNTVVIRRNARGDRSAAEGLIAALRRVYRRAVTDGYLDAADNPAAKAHKPRRLPSARQAIADTRIAEIFTAAAVTDNDPELDSLRRPSPPFGLS